LKIFYLAHRQTGSKRASRIGHRWSIVIGFASTKKGRLILVENMTTTPASHSTSSSATSNPSAAKTPYTPLREVPTSSGWKKGDVMVVFGELFARGYANGIVDEAERAGLKIIRSTVGRRDADGTLRTLNAEEVAAQAAPFINIPLEAGFDLEPSAQGVSPADQLKSIKMSDWENAKLDWAQVEDSRQRGVARFRKNVEAYMKELSPHIDKGANVLFVHTMAGGVPRAKILMPTMNKVFKGTGDRHMPSETYWKSDIGRLSEMSFEEVSAKTLEHLIDLSAGVREQVEKNGGQVRYVAYGYHGTEVLMNGKYGWQSYAPYVQGWAKIELEEIAKRATKKGVITTVFNCPEILTNSSSIFQGVEVPVYTLINALRKEGPESKRTKEITDRAATLLKPEFSFAAMEKLTDSVLTNPAVQKQSNYDQWPQHNTKEQMETLINGSDQLIAMHKDEKQLMTAVLSEEVFRACGYVMFNEGWKPHAPALWLGHDVLAKALVSGKTL
jgi:hypothetical protein